MSPPPLMGFESAAHSKTSVAASLSPTDCMFQNDSGLKEHHYLELSDCSSSVDSSAVSSLSEESKNNINLKATELRLGLPGSQSPESELDFCLMKSRNLDEKPLFPLLPLKEEICSLSPKSVASSNKRGFSEVKSFVEANWMFSDSESSQYVGQAKFPGKLGINMGLPARTPGRQAAIMKEAPERLSQERPRPTSGTGHSQAAASNDNIPPAKAQVVGWPPIRSFRKNTMATSSKNSDEVDGKPGSSALFIKVSMEGAPYLRKVDLQTYCSYQELSSALEKMFGCFIIGQDGSHGAPGKEMLNDSKLKDLHHGSEYVLTYEDKDADWMLVGDVPWEMFIGSCKRLKIMKSSDAIGLARGE